MYSLVIKISCKNLLLPFISSVKMGMPLICVPSVSHFECLDFRYEMQTLDKKTLAFYLQRIVVLIPDFLVFFFHFLVKVVVLLLVHELRALEEKLLTYYLKIGNGKIK